VLLIAFSVALGAVVMSWGEDYINEKAPFVQGVAEVGGACDSASVSIIVYKEVPQICTRGDQIDLFIRNGVVGLSGIRAQVVGSDGVALIENILETPLKPDLSIKTTIAHQPVGTVMQVILTPAVENGGAREFCRQSETKVEELRTC
jgi:hypothetical protein